MRSHEDRRCLFEELTQSRILPILSYYTNKQYLVGGSVQGGEGSEIPVPHSALQRDVSVELLNMTTYEDPLCLIWGGVGPVEGITAPRGEEPAALPSCRQRGAW